MGDDVSWYDNPPNDLIEVGIGPPDAIDSDSNTRFSSSLIEPDSFKGEDVLDKRVVVSVSDDSNEFTKKDCDPPPRTTKGLLIFCLNRIELAVLE